MKNIKPDARWRLFLGLLGVLIMTLACVAVGTGTNTATSTPASSEVPIQLEDGVIEVRDETGDWTPVSGDSSFDLTAELESIDPWKVAGISLETNASTQIEEGLQVGDLVRVRGIVQEDGTWLANSIERAASAEQVDPIIILIGKVDSVDPWVVNGIQLNVTGDTEVRGAITPGMFVRVEILLLPDDTWEVLSIAPLGDFEGESGCVTVVATILRVEGTQIQLSGWPLITLDEDTQVKTESGGEVTLQPNQTVLVVVCPSGETQVVIVQIIVLNIDEGEASDGGGEKVLICHKPDKKGGHTISISPSAVPAHLAHGDTEGPCP